MGSFYEQKNSSDERKTSVLADILKSFGEPRRRDELDKAQRDEKLLMAIKEGEEQTQKVILELQESARREEAKWKAEKRNIENKVNAQERLDERAQPPLDHVDKQNLPYKEEVDRLYKIIGTFNEQKRQELVSRKISLKSHAYCGLKRCAVELQTNYVLICLETFNCNSIDQACVHSHHLPSRQWTMSGYMLNLIGLGKRAYGRVFYGRARAQDRRM